MMELVRAVYPGTFDPITNGHVDLMRRGAKLFDELVVGVALNQRKNPLFSLDERVRFIREATAGIENMTIRPFDILLVDFAREQKATVIMKGLRAVSDFEYELQLSLTNRRLDQTLETVFMMPSEEYSFVSSTVVKEVALLGGDIASMAPDVVFRALSKMQDHRNPAPVHTPGPKPKKAKPGRQHELASTDFFITGKENK